MSNQQQIPEGALADRIRAALRIAMGINGDAPSRENSLVITHLEDALFRAERDVEHKMPVAATHEYEGGDKT